ncbi:MAG: hypothetical protein ACR2L2_10875 [Acidobacteriota bacterium]
MSPMIQDRLPGQFNCTTKNDKGKPCLGLLKKYFPFKDYFNETENGRLRDIQKEFGKQRDLMLYRCQDCQTLYKT